LNLSSGSVWSENTSLSDQAFATTDRYSAHLDHSYGSTPNTKRVTIESFEDHHFGPFTSDLMDPITLFEDLSAYTTAFDDTDADFANAPTPFMSSNFADLNDIESDDLLDLDLDSNQCKSIDNSNNIDTSVVDMCYVDNEVEIGVNAISALNVGNDSQFYDNKDSDQCFERQLIASNDKNTRKRNNSYLYADNDSEDDDEEEEVDFPIDKKRKGKVGRKPSKGQNKCMSRNAIAARENRERKKAYVEDMEMKLKKFNHENKVMKSKIDCLTKRNEELDYEVNYLKGIIENDTTISAVIKHMSSFKQIKLVGTEFMATTEAVPDLKGVRKSTRIATKGEISPPINKLKPSFESAGVCLHIHNKKVSLELCAKCSQKHNRKGK